MKKIILALGVLTTINTWAANTERVILADSKAINTMVSDSTVRCSDIGYGNLQLKLNIAALDGWTLFDHTNSHVGEFGEPCMTAGRCTDKQNVGTLVNSNPKNEAIVVNRTVTEIKREQKQVVDDKGTVVETCERSLREVLTTVVRGLPFKHTREGANQSFPIEVCRK